MIRTLLLIALMAVLSFAAAPVSAPLSVKDGKIVDKSNNPFVLRGMSMFWNRSDWPGGKFYKQSTITTLANDWKANVVRAAIGNGNVDDAKNFMDWTWNAGIYVIVDWHYHTLEQNATTFFNSVASYAKQKGYNHVIYEIFNEPCSGAAGTNCGSAISWSSIKTYSESIISTIRAQDSDGLIVVGTPAYSSDIGSARANPITGQRNILYSLHFYTSDPAHDSYQTVLAGAWCNDFPVFATEWGTSMADGGDKNKNMDWDRTNTWMSLVESLGISWANWSIVDKDETAAALTLNCCSGGTFGDNNLSTSGKYVQTIMKARNGGGGITSANGSNLVNLKTIDPQCSGGSGTQAGQKTGIVKVGGSATNAVDFVPESLSGAKDSTILSNAPVLQSTATTLSVGYKLTDIPGPGTYRMRIRYGSTAAVTLSWSGSGLESGTFELPSTGGTSTWKNSDYIPITITTSGETPLNLTFSGANGFVFVNIQASADPSSTPSSSSGGDPTPITLPQVVYSNSLSAMQNSVNLQVAREASFKVFDLKGNQVRSLKFAQGNHIVSLADLPKGLYIVKAQFGSQREVLRMVVR